MLLFIFDMDEVLYRYDWRHRMAGMTELTGFTLDELRERWWNRQGEWAAEAGLFTTPEDYLNAFEAAMGMPVNEAEWVRVRGSAMTVVEKSIAAVERAAQFGQITLLTNNGALTSKHLRTLAPELVPVFGDHLFTSSDYGARKPDPDVFSAVLKQYQAEPLNTFFADDMIANVEGARSLGITAHHFLEPDGLLSAIEEFAASRGVSPTE